MYDHILLPTDGTSLSERAVEQAIALARKLGAKVSALHVVGQHYPHFTDEGYDVIEIRTLRERFRDAEAANAERILEAVRAAAEAQGVACDTLTVAGESVHEKILEQADKLKCDLIVMASHGRMGLDALLMGSETAKVVTHSKIPVMVCH